MKQIDRALADAARQLEPTSDTARLDAELLMAESLHIDRDRLILSPPSRAVPERFWDMVERRKRGEPKASAAAGRIHAAVNTVIAAGKHLTRDLGGQAGTTEMGDAIAAAAQG